MTIRIVPREEGATSCPVAIATVGNIRVTVWETIEDGEISYYCPDSRFCGGEWKESAADTPENEIPVLLDALFEAWDWIAAEQKKRPGHKEAMREALRGVWDGIE